MMLTVFLSSFRSLILLYFRAHVHHKCLRLCVLDEAQLECIILPSEHATDSRTE